MKPQPGDLVLVHYHDLEGDAGGDPETGSLSVGECAGWFRGYRVRKGKRCILTARARFDDGSFQGYDLYPVSVVDRITVLRRKDAEQETAT